MPHSLDDDRQSNEFALTAGPEGQQPSKWQKMNKIDPFWTHMKIIIGNGCVRISDWHIPSSLIDVIFDFASGGFHVLGQAGHLEYWLPFTAWRDDISVGVLKYYLTILCAFLF
jgi:hypothetical protein